MNKANNIVSFRASVRAQPSDIEFHNVVADGGLQLTGLAKEVAFRVDAGLPAAGALPVAAVRRIRDSLTALLNDAASGEDRE